MFLTATKLWRDSVDKNPLHYLTCHFWQRRTMRSSEGLWPKVMESGERWERVRKSEEEWQTAKQWLAHFLTCIATSWIPGIVGWQCAIKFRLSSLFSTFLLHLNLEFPDQKFNIFILVNIIIYISSTWKNSYSAFFLSWQTSNSQPLKHMSARLLSEPLYSSAPNVLWASACAIQSPLDTASRLFLGSQRTNRKHY